MSGAMAEGWDWLDPLAPVTKAGEGAAKAEDDVAGQLAACFARCFASVEGRRVLAYLRRLTIERHLAPMDGPGGHATAEAALWYLEGQRALVARMEMLVRRGHHEPLSPTEQE